MVGMGALTDILLEELRSAPWMLAVVAGSFVIWLVAVVLVVRSPKFLRKWLWVLCTLVAFGISWSVGEGVTLGVGIPVGAAYVIWFWRFGAAPTPEQIARRAVQTKSPAFPRGSGKIVLLRGAYIVAAMSAGLMAWLLGSGRVWRLFEKFVGAQMPTMSGMLAGQWIVLLGLAGAMLFLAFRPYWWGKLLCAWAGLSWTGFAAVGSLMFLAFDTTMALILVAGLGMLAALVCHQIVDPRFGGSYLRASPS